MPELPGDLGGERMPLAVPAAGATIAGKALDILLAYLKAGFTYYAGTAWASIAPGEPIVKKTFPHDPEQYNFSQNDLPALYLFPQRSAKEPEQLAEDWRVHTDVLRCFWVLPPARSVDFQAQRAPIINYLGQLIDELLWRGRDASYVIAGDADLTAAFEGSVVLRHAGLKRMRSTGWAVGQIAIRVPGTQESAPYPLLDCTLEVERRLVPDYTAEPTPFAAPARLDLEVVHPDGTLILSEALILGAFSDAFSDAFDN